MTAKPRDDRADWPLGHLSWRGGGQTPAGEPDPTRESALGPWTIHRGPFSPRFPIDIGTVCSKSVARERDRASPRSLDRLAAGGTRVQLGR